MSLTETIKRYISKNFGSAFLGGSTNPTELAPAAPTNSADRESDLNSLTVANLKAMAKSRGLRGYSRLSKADLVDLLS